MLEQVSQLVVQLRVFLDHLIKLLTVFFLIICRGAIKRELRKRCLERVDTVALETHARAAWWLVRRHVMVKMVIGLFWSHLLPSPTVVTLLSRAAPHKVVVAGTGSDREITTLMHRFPCRETAKGWQTGLSISTLALNGRKLGGIE